MAFTGGDEIGALVFETGSSVTKCGFAGEDVPKGVFSSSIGRGQDAAKYVGNTITHRKDNVDIVSAFKDGLVEDWDLYEAIVDHCYKAKLMSDPKEHPVLFGEPAFNTNANREKLTEILFEKFGVPAMFVAKNPALNIFSVGKSTGLVLDVGGQVTYATPVHDGYALKKAVSKSPIGGDLLNEHLLNILQQKNINVRPSYSIKKKINGDTLSVEDLSFPLTSPSFHKFSQLEVIRDIKESICKTAEIAFDEHTLSAIPSVSYELPDGQSVEMGADRFRVAEALFQPEILKNDYTRAQSLPALVVNSVNMCDAEIRKDMYHNVVVMGGSSLFPSLPERLAHELATQVAAFKVKTVAPPVPSERKYSAWIGGSIIASLGTFHQMWISKQEYLDHGKVVVEKKCP